MSQILLTVLTKVKPDKVAPLKELLDDISNHLLENPYLAFTALKRLHFASLILNENASEAEINSLVAYVRQLKK